VLLRPRSLGFLWGLELKPRGIKVLGGLLAWTHRRRGALRPEPAGDVGFSKPGMAHLGGLCSAEQRASRKLVLVTQIAAACCG
jgi:hypothetical protein